MIKVFVLFSVILVLCNMFIPHIMINMNKKLNTEGNYDPSYKLNSYKIKSELSSSKEIPKWYEQYSKKEKKEVDGTLSFEDPKYQFYFETNIKSIKKYENLSFLEMVDSPFIENIVYYLKGGRSLRFFIKKSVLFFYINDYFSPNNIHLLKEECKINDYKNYKPKIEEIKFKNEEGKKKTDFTELELFLLYLDASIINFPASTSSLDALVVLLQLEPFSNIITLKNKKLILWHRSKPLLILNLDYEEIKKIIAAFLEKYPALERIKKILDDSTFYMKYSKNKITVKKYSESGNNIIVFDFYDSEIKNKDEKMKSIEQLLVKEDVSYDLSISGCTDEFVKLLKRLKNFVIHDVVYFIR